VACGWVKRALERNDRREQTLNERIYNRGGTLRLSRLTSATGGWRQLGKPEFGRTRHIFAAEGPRALYRRRLRLYLSTPRMEAAPGRQSEDFDPSLAAVAVLGRALVRATRSGAFVSESVTTGSWTAVGKPLLAIPFTLFESGRELYRLMRRKSLCGRNAAPCPR